MITMELTKEAHAKAFQIVRGWRAWSFRKDAERTVEKMRKANEEMLKRHGGYPIPDHDRPRGVVHDSFQGKKEMPKDFYDYCTVLAWLEARWDEHDPERKRFESWLRRYPNAKVLANQWKSLYKDVADDWARFATAVAG